MSESVLPMFSSRNFIVFSLTFRALIHFEFIFAYSIRECSNFILLHVKAVQSSQNHFWRDIVFSSMCVCVTHMELNRHFSKEDIKMANSIWKDAEQYPSSWKCKSKPEWGITSHLLEWLESKKHAKFWWGCREKGIVRHCW